MKNSAPQYMNRGFYPVRPVNAMDARDFATNTTRINNELSEGMTSEEHRRLLINRATTLMGMEDRIRANRLACPHCPYQHEDQKHLYVVPRRT